MVPVHAAYAVGHPGHPGGVEPEPVEAFVQAVEAAEPDKAKRETLLQKLGRMRVVERVHRISSNAANFPSETKWRA